MELLKVKASTCMFVNSEMKKIIRYRRLIAGRNRVFKHVLFEAVLSIESKIQSSIHVHLYAYIKLQTVPSFMTVPVYIHEYMFLVPVLHCTISIATICYSSSNGGLECFRSSIKPGVNLIEYNEIPVMLPSL
jgi:hypothetical protein